MGRGRHREEFQSAENLEQKMRIVPVLYYENEEERDSRWERRSENA